jgi:hypothetical protein
MMLSIEHPELCETILQYPGGIHCVRLSGETVSRIILKLPISFLLPAKLRQGLKVYVVPLSVGGQATAGLMCAFFDDADSPLLSWRLLDDSEQTLDLTYALTKQDVLVHLFDEQGREYLGYRASIDTPCSQLSSATPDENLAISSARASSGVLHPSVSRGRPLRSRAISLSSVWLAIDRSLPLGRN